MTFNRIISFLLITFILAAAGSAGAQDLLAQALAAQKAKHHEKAVELLGQYVKQDPHQPKAWLARAQSLAALGRREQALGDLEKGLASNPKKPALMLAKGKILGEMERRPEAIATLSELLALEPKNVEALKERAENLINEAGLDKARADLAKAKSLAPRDPWIYHKMGMTELCLNHYGKAVEDFSTAIRFSPQTPLFYFSRGELYLRHLHDKAKARADFEKGCSLGLPLCCNELEMLNQSSKKPQARENDEFFVSNSSCPGDVSWRKSYGKKEHSAGWNSQHLYTGDVFGLDHALRSPGPGRPGHFRRQVLWEPGLPNRNAGETIYPPVQPRNPAHDSQPPGSDPHNSLLRQP